MKLLFCIRCQDLFRLTQEQKRCKCGVAGGQYLDEVNAEYTGYCAIPLGISNESFKHALKKQPKEGLGAQFTAFVIAEECNTFKQVKHLFEKNNTMGV